MKEKPPRPNPDASGGSVQRLVRRRAPKCRKNELEFDAANLEIGTAAQTTGGSGLNFAEKGVTGPPFGIPIESGVPVPDMRGKFNFVFDGMRNGDSFMVPNDQQRQRALMSAKRMGHKATSIKVNGTGYRVWLISKA